MRQLSFIPLVLFLILVLTLPSTAAQSRSMRPGSIYDADAGPVTLIGNKTARRPGDLVTVIISETQNLKNEEKTDLTTDSSLSKQLVNFDIKPNLFSTAPALESTSSDQFAGEARYERKGNFTARLTAIVTDALPNGNLVLQGRREIRIDGEIKVIEFSGVVRRYDVSSDNSIQSELVADAHVSYSGTGPLSNATRRRGLAGWFHDAIMWLWPF
jgi:flagellar L-ring protein precursor FlgH